MKSLYNHRKITLVFALSIVLGSAVWCGFQVFEKGNERVAIKNDYSVANSLIYGLFSANEWKKEVETILSQKIAEFEFSEKQDSLARVQVNSLLNSVITEVKNQVNQSDQNLKEKIRKVSVNLLVDWDDLRQNVPRYTDAIMEDLKKNQSKDRLKTLFKSKLEEFAAQTYDDSDSLKLQKIYEEYGTDNLADFNDTVHRETVKLEKQNARYTFSLLGILGLLLVSWFLLWRQQSLHPVLFPFSVIIGFVVLLTGLLVPMIEIDARIESFDFVLLGEHISFQNQILFYRSKSILEVVQVLLQSPRFDSILVGFLILAFSVLLPFSKLTANGIYLFSKAGIRENKVIKWLTFNSGKWSMADVLVVAIFMAFIGFDGIIDNQLQMVAYDEPGLRSIATNKTSLLSGFTLFLSFVLYSLILSEILSRLTTKPNL